MKLVIDIPEILLDRIKSAKCVPDMYGSDIVNAVVCVRDGTPYEERPHGEWKWVDYGGFGNWHCTNCRFIPAWKSYSITVPYGFCPNCGALMSKKEGAPE